MSWCKKEEANLFKEIINIISLEYKMSKFLIEKDLIQSIFLYKLSSSNIPFVFKGGTSLSKSYDIIARFSEDIDLSLSKHISVSDKRKVVNLIKNIGNELEMVLINEDLIKSRYDYNKFVFQCLSIVDNSKIEILVETSFYIDAYPVENRKIDCYLNKFFINNNINNQIFNLYKSFDFCVQSLNRTLIDKVFAVCDYKIQNKIERNSRHLYDIAKIIPFVKFDKDFKTLVNKVRIDRLKSKSNLSADFKYNINDILYEIISSRIFESDYKDITSKLLYEEFSYDEAIDNGIRIIFELKIFN